MTKGKVLIAAPVHIVLKDGLQQAGYSLVEMPEITQAQAYELIGDCVGVITSTRLQLDKDLLDAASNLKWIGRMGSGMEVIDLSYAAKKGVRCFGSPAGNSNAVGEHALGMLLSLTKKITLSHQQINQGRWIREANRGIELEGKTIGIIGFGHTGRAFARKLAGFDVDILSYDKYSTAEVPRQITKCRDLETIYKEADIVSFHVPLQADTIHYFNDAFAQRMHKSFILVNTSRGPVADTQAILRGLENGKLSGACLDVVEGEPLEKMDGGQRTVFEEIASMPNVIVTPHIAGYTHESIYKMSKILLDCIVIAP